MADFMFVKDAAALWNISERQVSGLCSRGKIPGAVKQGRSWIDPDNMPKSPLISESNPEPKWNVHLLEFRYAYLLEFPT